MLKNIVGFFVILFAVLAVGWLAMQREDIPYDTLEIAYANDASEFIKLKDGLKVHYRDEGLIDGPTIVLVHGFSASLHTWEGWVKDLKTDHRVISLDLPAHGLTRAPKDYPVTIEQFVKTVDELTEFLGAERFILVGSSMGGNTSWEYALAHPEKLEGLVLIGASGWPAADDDANSEPFVFQLMKNPLARSLLKNFDMSILIRGGLEDSFVNQSLVTDEMVNRYASLSRAPGHRESILQMMVNRNDRRIATRELLSRITVPTLVLHGDTDNLVPVAAAHKFGDAIPGAEVTIYKNVGHLPQEEITDQSLVDFRAFLSSRVHLDPAQPDNSDSAAAQTPVPEAQ